MSGEAGFGPGLGGDRRQLFFADSKRAFWMEL